MMSMRVDLTVLLAGLLCVPIGFSRTARAAPVPPGSEKGTEVAEAEEGPPEAEEEGDAEEEEEEEEAPPPEALPPAQPLDLAAAEKVLSPYGHWVDTPEYGRVWVPGGVGADWQPYGDGQWAYTDWGWSFVGGAPWGWVGYHYGRWGWLDDIGWFWVPGFVWGPAWVSWRYYSGYICWSPFPPHGWHGLHGGHRWPGWVVVHRDHFGGSIAPHRVARPGPIVRAARQLPSVHSTPQRNFHTGPSQSHLSPHGSGSRGLSGSHGSGHSSGSHGGHHH
jgi:hypothetical protein